MSNDGSCSLAHSAAQRGKARPQPDFDSHQVVAAGSCPDYLRLYARPSLPDGVDEDRTVVSVALFF